MTRIGWIDASVGAAGDMLAAALVGAGAPYDVMSEAVAALGVPVTTAVETVEAQGLSARRWHVTTGEADPPRRTWADVRALLDAADLDPAVRALAHDAFERLATAEAAVHGTAPDAVHFHEVGAHDAIADIVGAAAGFVALRLDAVVVSPVALGGGTAHAGHGLVPVPAPAVLEILRSVGAPAFGGPVDVELCTPTGAALLASVATAWGPMPPMRVETVGLGAGTRTLAGRPNVVRLVVGEAADAPAGAAAAPDPGLPTQLLLETNVDDLDPRLWPAVLARLLEVGVADAWLTPILMKKGRPAHTLSVLVDAEVADAARRVVFAETSTIGLRETVVGKRALVRRTCSIAISGQPVRVKLAELDGAVVNAQPEYDDVVAAAAALGRPIKAVLAEAAALAARAATLPGASAPAAHDAPPGAE
ncbi:MAG TPA: nickel pincer cofactor biosynthesis protein LarC [Actinomycetes bacterium]|nr:nickel pincer cofactor biosynthesis protein LarC [Actinomycetes bacterium]